MFLGVALTEVAPNFNLLRGKIILLDLPASPGPPPLVNASTGTQIPLLQTYPGSQTTPSQGSGSPPSPSSASEIKMLIVTFVSQSRSV